MARKSAMDERHERRSNALASIFGVMGAFEGQLPEGFERAVVKQLEEHDVDQRPSYLDE